MINFLVSLQAALQHVTTLKLLHTCFFNNVKYVNLNFLTSVFGDLQERYMLNFFTRLCMILEKIKTERLYNVKNIS